MENLVFIKELIEAGADQSGHRPLLSTGTDGRGAPLCRHGTQKRECCHHGAMMSNEQKSEDDSDQPKVYQIRIKGHLSQQWQDWFEGLTITLEEDGNTLLSGPVVDQSALHGILKKIRDLGMPLLSINSIGPNQSTNPDARQVKGDI